MSNAPDSPHPGLQALLDRPLIETIWHRRTHRVSRGSSVAAGGMSYESANRRKPLTPLEEAVLIALTGCTGLTMPDRPLTTRVMASRLWPSPTSTWPDAPQAAPTTRRARTSS